MYELSSKIDLSNLSLAPNRKVCSTHNVFVVQHVTKMHQNKFICSGIRAPSILSHATAPARSRPYTINPPSRITRFPSKWTVGLVTTASK